MVLNGYAKRTGKYVKGGETSVLGLVKSYNKAGYSTDVNGNPYPIIGFGTGKKRLENDRIEARGALADNDSCNPAAGPAGKFTDSRGTDIDKEGWCTGTASDDFQQEAVVQTGLRIVKHMVVPMSSLVQSVWVQTTSTVARKYRSI